MSTGDALPDRELRGRGLQDLKAVLDSLGIPFVLEGGALLGAVRERDFILWDDDVGVACRMEDVSSRGDEIAARLRAGGFEVLSLDAGSDNAKINACKYGTRYEVLGWYLKGRMRRRRHYRMPAAFLDDTTEIELRGVRYPCPRPPERYLRHFYGNWRVPKSKGPFFTIRCQDQKTFWSRQLRKLLGRTAQS